VAQKLPPAEPLPADIMMRMGGSYESYEAAFRAYKAAWMSERASADVVIGVAELPGRADLWTVVSFTTGVVGSNPEAPGVTMIRGRHGVIRGQRGVFEPVIAERELGTCPGIELPFQDDGTTGLDARGERKATRMEKTIVFPDPEYVLITRRGEYHFRQSQDEATAAQIVALLGALDDCAAS
jgi:hypothetical protein